MNALKTLYDFNKEMMKIKNISVFGMSKIQESIDKINLLSKEMLMKRFKKKDF